ncbi:MAG: pentapeptide repeat-containing protein [Candidatus Brocadiales bacterium]|nr:pentapeptide repeat-containing protein [Candidatus Bathyanammoxibius amoris]
MGCIKISLSAAALIVSIGFVTMVPGTHSDVAYGASVEENRENLLKTKECVGCNLEGVNLEHVALRGADLHYSNLHNAKMRFARLHSANLNGADLSGADLRSVDLRSADMRYTALVGAIVKNADLRGAIGITPAQKKHLRKRGAIINQGDRAVPDDNDG